MVLLLQKVKGISFPLLLLLSVTKKEKRKTFAPFFLFTLLQQQLLEIKFMLALLTARGASSPAKPALHIPEPLSITNYKNKNRKRDEKLCCRWRRHATLEATVVFCTRWFYLQQRLRPPFLYIIFLLKVKTKEREKKRNARLLFIWEWKKWVTHSIWWSALPSIYSQENDVITLQVSIFGTLLRRH